MDLDIFKTADTRKRLFAAEKVSLVYNLLTSVLVLILYRQLDHPLRMLADRALIAGATFLLAYLYRLAPCRLAAFIRVSVQMALLSYWYPDTYEFNRLFPNLDHVFASAEQWLFGGQPSVWFAARLPYMWLSEPLNMGYFFYYPMMLIIVLWYFIRRFDQLEKVSFVIISSFFLYYFFYILVPVAGPQFYFPAIGTENTLQGVFPPVGDYFSRNRELVSGAGYEHGFFYSLVESSQQVGERPTAAFPSSHVGISTILMIMAWRGSRRLFACLMPFYVLLCCATVYIQAHYLIDSIAGFVSAFGLYAFTARAYRRCFVRPSSR